MAWVLCWFRPHKWAIQSTWVTIGNVTAEHPVRYCVRCRQILEVYPTVRPW
ncbi:hypothetical protein ABH925_001152 [Streptacidiphilus sp. EB129]|jgi:hypothetical protein